MIIRIQPATAYRYSSFYVDQWTPGRGWTRIYGRTVNEAAQNALCRINARRWAAGLTPATLGTLKHPGLCDDEAARIDVIATNTADTSEMPIEC